MKKNNLFNVLSVSLILGLATLDFANAKVQKSVKSVKAENSFTKQFEKIDSDSNKCISLDEYMAYSKNGVTITDEVISENYKKMDANNDSCVNEDEFKASTKKSEKADKKMKKDEKKSTTETTTTSSTVNTKEDKTTK